MKKLLFILVPALFLVSGNTYSQSPGKLPAQWMVLNEAVLQVEGKTNISSFSCTIKGYKRQDTLYLQNKQLNNGHFPASGILGFNTADFGCGNPVMNSELRKTLQSKAYPEMTIHFVSLEKLPDVNSKDQTIRGLMNIRLAGKLRPFEVNCQFYTDNKGNVHARGERYVYFSEFGLTAPRKFGGLLETEDRLKVQFDLLLKPVGNQFL
jgi:hypothetical protein